MHDAFAAETIFDSAKQSVAALHAYTNKLILVDSYNTLTHYEVSEYKYDINGTAQASATKENALKLLKTIKSFCRTKPLQMYAIKETGMLLVLADSYLSIYSLIDFTLDQKLSSTKGATTFCVQSGADHTSGIPVLRTQVAVCVKRQVLLFTWLDSEFEGEKHFECPDRGKTIEFLTSTKLVVAMTTDFVTIDLVDNTVEALQIPIGGPLSTVSTTMGYLGTRVPRSLLTRTSEQMLLVKDVQSCFIDSGANVLKVKSIGWASAPELVGFTYPYLIVVLKSRVEVRNAKSGAILQHFDIAGVQLLNDGKNLYIATAHKIHRLNTIPYPVQVDQLINSEQLSEALSLLEALDAVLLEDKAGMIRRTKQLMARQLFAQERFEESMDLFGESWTTPSVVVQLLPRSAISQSSSLSAHASEKDGDGTEDDAPPDSATQTSRTSIDDGARSQKVSENVSSLHDPQSASSKAAHRALSTYLARTRRLLMRFLGNAPKADSEEQFFTCWPDSRPLSQNEMEHELGIADTSLLRIYIINSPSLVGSLVRLANRCDPDVVKDYLVQEDRWRELVDFYYGKQLHDQALQLLQENDAVDMGVQYLQRLDVSYWPVISKYAPWVFKSSIQGQKSESLESAQDANGGPTDISPMDIFTDSSRESDSFDRADVARLLTSIDSTFGMQYLEFIIKNRGDTTPHFSEDLIYLYIDTERESDLVNFLESDSNAASASRIYSHIPHSAKFFEARALVLASMGNLQSALEIYVRKIKDPAKTEEFAVKQYKNDPSAFEVLLNLYLTPSTGAGESQDLQVNEALDLLKRHGRRLDADQVLSSLPPHTSLSAISSYLRSRLQSNLSLAHSSLIENKLRETALLKAQLDVIQRRSRYWEVGPDRVCGVCHKRLGNSVLAVFPDGAMVHYGCQKRYSPAS